MKIVKDHHREGFTPHKVIQMFKLFLPKYTKCVLRIKEFSELDLKKIEKIIGNKIEGIILDVDDTISYNRDKILEKNIRFLNEIMNKGVKIALYSNMIWTRRYENLNKKIIVLSNIEAKPHPEGFKKALKKLGTKKKNTIMVGDNFITDGGSIAVGIPFIKVVPIKTIDKNLLIRILRLPHRALRWFYNEVSLFHDKFIRGNK